MSYQVLARKWRPKRFADTVGQDHVLKALSNALLNDRVHHAYVFTGTRGVGKTTLARIVAKCLNCEAGMSAEPCGQCRSCIEIDEGRFVDLIEVDAASRTKVDDTRELLDNVQYAPSRGRFKVYLIDEVHMLSGHSFNALLKTLEEPPPHVQFLLATTEPQKLPATVLSRCVQFHLRNLSPEQIADHLRRILEQENVEADPTAITELAHAAEGSVRDALSLTDQAIVMGGGKISQDDVLKMLGATSRSQMRALVDALVDQDAAAALIAISTLSGHAVDFERVLADLLSTLHRIAVAQIAPVSVDDSAEESEHIIRWSRRVSAEDLQLFYHLGVAGRRDIPYMPDPRAGLEMIVLRMLAFRPQRPTFGATPVAKGVKGSAAVGEAARSTKKSDPAPRPEPVAEKPDENAGVGQAPSETRFDWRQVYPALKLSGVVSTVAANCSFVGEDSGCLCFLLDEEHSVLYSPQCDERLAAALSNYLNREVQVRIDTGSLQGESPARFKARKAAQAQQTAQEAIDKDPSVRLLLDRFSGTLHRDTIVPVQDGTEE